MSNFIAASSLLGGGGRPRGWPSTAFSASRLLVDDDMVGGNVLNVEAIGAKARRAWGRIDALYGVMNRMRRLSGDWNWRPMKMARTVTMDVTRRLYGRDMSDFILYISV